MRGFLMKLDENQLGKLWRRKAVFYYGRKKGRSLGAELLFLGILLFVVGGASEFNRVVLKFSALFYVIYFLVLMILNRKINSVKSANITKEKFAALRVLLFAVQDFAVVAVVWFTVVAAGNSTLVHQTR